MDKLKRALSGDDQDEEQGIMTQMYEASTLSWSTRIRGFLICFILGFALSIMGTFFMLMRNGIVLFGIFYTLGNITAMASTCFLMGPINQIKKMFAATRIIATILVLVFLVLTLMAGIWWKNPGLTIMFGILQFFAMTWYSISYIPFARDAIKKCATSCMG